MQGMGKMLRDQHFTLRVRRILILTALCDLLCMQLGCLPSLIYAKSSRPTYVPLQQRAKRCLQVTSNAAPTKA